MPYMKETCVAGRTVEVRRYYNFHVPYPGEHRGKREHPTPERIRKANLRKAETDLRRLINANFTNEGYSVTITYRTGEEPGDIDELRKDAALYLRKITRAAKKRGQIFKYVYVLGAGAHRRHIHIIMQGMDVKDIGDMWDKGHVSMTRLYSEPDFRELAAYFIKNAEDTREQEISQGKKPRRRYNTSHNLKKPLVKKEKIPAKEFRKNPRIPKGYQLDKETMVNGISDLTGMPYQSYTLLKDKENVGSKFIHCDRAERKHKRKRSRSIRDGDDAEERPEGSKDRKNGNDRP